MIAPLILVQVPVDLRPNFHPDRIEPERKWIERSKGYRTVYSPKTVHPFLSRKFNLFLKDPTWPLEGYSIS